MGKKLDAIRQKSTEGKETFRAGQELGKKAVSDTKQMKSIIDSLPADVDDEIAAAAKAVSEGTKADAENYMQSEVSNKVEAGKKSMEASSKDASDQIKNNERVKAAFERMDGVGNFGRGARETGRGQIDQSTSEFNAAISENDRAANEAQREFEKELSDISSTF
ncbi:hypothetical protein [Butyrivibrio sp. AC2005]|uniref:hypothetical protein n=1 Tax=Butyrivibrio sp. AC2005 TaxID=1280672 RepID=UPI00041936F7|nr:hypothetical protein [Butyrivibrio sp. AC2005]